MVVESSGMALWRGVIFSAERWEWEIKELAHEKGLLVGMRWEENVPEKGSYMCKAWRENRAVYFWRTERKPGRLGWLKEGQNGRRGSQREASWCRALKDVERNLAFIPSTMKLTGLKPGCERTWYPFLKACFGCWVMNDSLYIIDLFYLFNSTHHNRKFARLCIYLFIICLLLPHTNKCKLLMWWFCPFSSLLFTQVSKIVPGT